MALLTITRPNRTGKRPSARLLVNGVQFDALPWEPSPAKTIPHALSCYMQGATLRELAKRYQVSVPTMAKMMWACGAKRRRGGFHGGGRKERP